MASGDERMNGCKWWSSCIARMRFRRQEATNPPPDFGDIIFERHYQLLMRMGLDEKIARLETLKRQAEKKARQERLQMANQGGGASSSRTNIPEAGRKPNPPRAVDSRVENMLDGWIDNITENLPSDVDEEAKQLSSNKCGGCGMDEGRMHTWSGCGDTICDACMVYHLDYMIDHKVWNVRCRVKGCREHMTAEECRVFFPDNQDRVNDWIASIPEADRTS